MSDDHLYVRVPKIVLLFLVLLATLGTLYIIADDAEAQEVACYEGGDELVTPEFENKNLLITVNWYDTVADLQEALDDPVAEAYSECEVHFEDGDDIGFCEIWVVRPSTVLGDPHIDALGHEVLHGLIGDFHE